jgi:hypothetical protein
LREARLILRFSRDLAIAVRDGTRRFDEVLREVEEKHRALQGAEQKLARLRADAPDLAELVAEERLSIDEAISTAEHRLNEARAVEGNRRETLLRLIANGCFAVTAWKNGGSLAATIELLDDETFRRKLTEKVDAQEGLDATGVKARAEALTALLGRRCVPGSARPQARRR